MLENYFSALMFVVVGLGFGCVPILMGWSSEVNTEDESKLTDGTRKPKF